MQERCQPEQVRRDRAQMTPCRTQLCHSARQINKSRYCAPDAAEDVRTWLSPLCFASCVRVCVFLSVCLGGSLARSNLSVRNVEAAVPFTHLFESRYFATATAWPIASGHETDVSVRS